LSSNQSLQKLKTIGWQLWLGSKIIWSSFVMVKFFKTPHAALHYCCFANYVIAITKFLINKRNYIIPKNLAIHYRGMLMLNLICCHKPSTTNKKNTTV